jgi:hypothetical protein
MKGTGTRRALRSGESSAIRGTSVEDHRVRGFQFCRLQVQFGVKLAEESRARKLLATSGSG